MVQRMGRTGRKKEGSIVVLVTEGKEQETLKNCLIHKNNVTYHVLQSKEIAKGLVPDCPKMLVEGQIPVCEKIFITVKKPALKKNNSLKVGDSFFYNLQEIASEFLLKNAYYKVLCLHHVFRTDVELTQTTNSKAI